MVWSNDFIEWLSTKGRSLGININIYSFILNLGYPRCYQQLMLDALNDKDIELIHFVDQDDYCLSNRFSNRSISNTQASSILITNEYLIPFKHYTFDGINDLTVLGTPTPGMSFSVPRSIIEEYIALCEFNNFTKKMAHDFVISQISIHKKLMSSTNNMSMLYIQHAANTIGQATGLAWMTQKILNIKLILKRKKENAILLGLIYGEQRWLDNSRLHRNKIIDIALRIYFKFNS